MAIDTRITFSYCPSHVIREPSKMNSTAKTARTPLVNDADVYAFAEDHDCSLLVARETLEAEALSDLIGEPVNYQVQS